MKTLPWLLAIVCAALAGFLFATRPSQTTSPAALEAVIARASRAVLTVRTDIADLSDPNSRGVGTAFHIGDGIFITAAHVVDSGTKIYLDPRARTVASLDGLEAATLLGTVAEFDLAVLRGAVLPDKLVWAQTAPLVGSSCLAIGNPFARAPRSVTLGIISGVQRLQPTPKGALAGLVQFDAQVNPGNSGGALLNLQGEVLGVVSSILSATGTSAGVGFAVATSTIQAAVETLVRGEKVALPRLGVSSQDSSAVVQTVLPGGLAAQAGLQPDDVLLEIDGLPVDTLSEANAVVGAAKSGSSLAVKAKRRGAVRDFTVLIP